MSEHSLKAVSRSDEGKGASRRLRHAGVIPAIVYGGKSAPKSIQLDHEPTWLAQQNEWFYSSIIDLEIDGKSEKVLLRDMQRHPYKQLIMHLDFQRVTAGQALRTRVPLHFANEDKSPAGKAADVVVTHELNEIEISCLPKNLPEFIEVDLSELKLGETIHLSELKLPKGVEIPELKLGKEHDVAVVVARAGRVEAEDSAAEEDSAEVPASKVEKGEE
ncbi:50S ribosomal protein L25/general stress protein Ctc [Marilutibacter maris]|uniref:Large ribosomal subunit protein bL25 n=1 Tax=Marilutibacter maris TaxID=1605891 RepID=A0A2U9TA25_9GAMM|nr:50S ribosomal protein L25/general stress protein Ctc [Lysobacter maris]AWV08037.1 50S ribosomal protein L25 [Lysobacter maris]KAB8162365.1 50S ribosomal protein L25/general stress protein Ctc [Lysobacter maris]